MAKKNNNGREAAALLATAIVLIFGFMGTMFLVATAVEDPLWPTLWTLAIFGGFSAIAMSSLRAREDGSSAGGLLTWFKGRKPSKMADYSPRRVKTSDAAQSSTTNEPPTADEVREIQESSSSTWVPSSVRKPKQ